AMDFPLRLAAGDVNSSLGVHEDIDLAADSELGQVNPRLNRETGPRHHPSFLARLQVVHVGAVAMRLLPDGVAGTMDEVLSITGLVDDRARGVIHLPPLEGSLPGKGLFHAVEPRVTRRGHDVEDLRVHLGYLLANECDAGKVAVDRARLV